MPCPGRGINAWTISAARSKPAPRPVRRERTTRGPPAARQGTGRSGPSSRRRPWRPWSGRRLSSRRSSCARRCPLHALGALHAAVEHVPDESQRGLAVAGGLGGEVAAHAVAGIGLGIDDLDLACAGLAGQRRGEGAADVVGRPGDRIDRDGHPARRDDRRAARLLVCHVRAAGRQGGETRQHRDTLHVHASGPGFVAASRVPRRRPDEYACTPALVQPSPRVAGTLRHDAPPRGAC